MKKVRYAFILSIVFSCRLSIINSIQLLSTPQGTLVGSKLTSRNGNQFYGFYSIPYAKPPVRELRFQPPQEPSNWTGVKNATVNPPICVQKDFLSVITPMPTIGQEDCLYLNVFTQQPQGKAPVLVYFHGGGFIAGAGHPHRANYLMDEKNLVFVTINYRIALLGFLSSGDKVLPGNNGLKDQVMALKWVKNYIAYFGGDPENVSIFGHSAGGVSVHLHMFSPLSKGLFHKAISLSGTASSPWNTSPATVMREYFKTIALLSGCSYSQTSDTVECLKQIPANDLLETQSKLTVWRSDLVGQLGPAIEPDTAFEPFLTGRPISGRELNPAIPWITGQTSAESIFKVADYLDENGTRLKYINDNYKRLLPIITLYKPHLDKLAESSAFADDLKKIYFQNRKIALETLKPLVELLSDTIFSFGTTESVLNYKGNRCYMYYFSYQSRSKERKQPYDKRLTELGVSHSEDMGYLFDAYGNLGRNEVMTDVDDLKISKNWIEILINFARTGSDPNTNSIKGFKWNPIKANSSAYLNISNAGFQQGCGYVEEKNKIWKDLSKYFN